MTVEEKIREKLESALTPDYLQIIDESDKHKGHMGASPGGETHFALEIVSKKFAGLSRMARHKLVMSLLKAEMAGGIHALSITANAP